MHQVKIDGLIKAPYISTPRTRFENASFRQSKGPFKTSRFHYLLHN